MGKPFEVEALEFLGRHRLVVVGPDGRHRLFVAPEGDSVGVLLGGPRAAVETSRAARAVEELGRLLAGAWARGAAESLQASDGEASRREIASLRSALERERKLYRAAVGVVSEVARLQTHAREVLDSYVQPERGR